MREATISAAQAGRPSMTSRWRRLVATSIAPTIIAMSKPPNAASTADGSIASWWRASAACPSFTWRDSSLRPMSGPVRSKSGSGQSVRRDSTSAAVKLAPRPTPAKMARLPRRR